MITLPTRKLNWSEGQQVLAIIAIAGVVMAVLWFLVLMPLNHRRKQLEREISTMSTQLAQNNYLLGEEPLRAKRAQEEARFLALSDQWTQAVARISMQAEQAEVDVEEVGHIDFKVRLYKVRQRLRQKSGELGVTLPYDLGIDDAVNSNEDARKLMLQLRAVEEMADLSLNLKIKTIQHIEPMPPVSHAAPGDPTHGYLEEFPVSVSLFGTTANLQELLRGVLGPGHVFLLKNLRVEKASAAQPDLLDIRAVFSALVFSDEALTRVQVEARAAAPAPSGPMGF